MCAQMRTVIDRTAARYTKLANKEFYFILWMEKVSDEQYRR